jgi:hypothetical protein
VYFILAVSLWQGEESEVQGEWETCQRLLSRFVAELGFEFYLNPQLFLLITVVSEWPELTVPQRQGPHHISFLSPFPGWEFWKGPR